MSRDRDIAELRRKFFGRRDADGLFYATIQSVDDAKRTCKVMDDNEMEYDDVLLYAVDNADLKGMVCIPKAESRVLVGRIGASNELYVAMASQIDKVLLTIGDKATLTIDADGVDYANDKTTIKITADAVEITSDKIALNGSDNGGLVKVEELKKNLDQLKQYVEAINTALPNAFTAVGAAMLANGPAGGTAYQGAMAGKMINFGAMDNDKVTH